MSLNYLSTSNALIFTKLMELIINDIKKEVLLTEIHCRAGLKTSKVGMFSRPTLNIFNGQPNMVNLKSWYTKDIGLEKKE